MLAEVAAHWAPPPVGNLAPNSNPFEGALVQAGGRPQMRPGAGAPIERDRTRAREILSLFEVPNTFNPGDAYTPRMFVSASLIMDYIHTLRSVQGREDANTARFLAHLNASADPPTALQRASLWVCYQHDPPAITFHRRNPAGNGPVGGNAGMVFTRDIAALAQQQGELPPARTAIAVNWEDFNTRRTDTERVANTIAGRLNVLQQNATPIAGNADAERQRQARIVAARTEIIRQFEGAFPATIDANQLELRAFFLNRILRGSGYEASLDRSATPARLRIYRYNRDDNTRGDLLQSFEVWRQPP